MPRTLQQIEDVITGRRPYALLQGDCLDIGRQLPAGVFDACIIDPPYGVAWTGEHGTLKPIANDDRPFVWWLYDAFRVLKNPGALACFCSWRVQQDFKTAIRLAGFDLRNHVIWDRMRPGMGGGHTSFMIRHEVIWFATKGRFRFPAGTPATVLPFETVPPQRRHHTTQKPHDLMATLVKRLTPPGGVVFDPCMGSGSTGHAAVAAGFRFVGVELDGDNFAIAERRLAEAARARREPKAKIPRATHCTLARRIAA